MALVLLITLLLLALFFFINSLRRRSFVNIFKKGNVSVFGLRGHGKDCAFAIVVNARKRNYVSNVQYSSPKKRFQRFEFDPSVWELAGNTHKNLISGNIRPYVYPYPDDIDYYISDCGIYFPAQYATDLCRTYPSAPTFMALSRHLGNCNIHTNSQAYGRVWDKLREQSHLYLFMRGVHFIPKTHICLVSAILYENEETADKHIVPPRFGFGRKGRDAKIAWCTSHGNYKKMRFFTRIPYRYNDREFKDKLAQNKSLYEVNYEKSKQLY